MRNLNPLYQQKGLGRFIGCHVTCLVSIIGAATGTIFNKTLYIKPNIITGYITSFTAAVEIILGATDDMGLQMNQP